MEKPKKRSARGGALISVSPTAAGVMFDGDDLSEWDDDELLRGRRRNKYGTFAGRQPNVVPIQLHHELTRRRMQRAYALLSHSLVDAARMLGSVVNDEEAPYEARIHAAEVMFNRVLGKPTEHVAFDLNADGGAPAWKQALAGAIVGSVDQIRELEAAKSEPDVIEGEVVAEDEPPKRKRPKQKAFQPPAKRAKRRAAVS